MCVKKYSILLCAIILNVAFFVNFSLANVSSVIFEPLNRDVSVSPGQTVAVVKMTITDDGSGDVWQSIIVLNAFKEAGNPDIYIDRSVTALRIFQDDNGNGVFDANTDVLASDRSAFSDGAAVLNMADTFDADGNRTDFDGRTIFSSRAYFFTMTVAPSNSNPSDTQPGAGSKPDDLINVDLLIGSMVFNSGGNWPDAAYQGGDTGPEVGGITNITIAPLNDDKYVPFGGKTAVVSFSITANAGGDMWESLTVNRVANLRKPVVMVQLYQDNSPTAEFGNEDGLLAEQAFNDSGEAKFENFNRWISNFAVHYLLVLTAAPEGIAIQGDLIDIDISADAFTFTKTKIAAPVYQGSSGPFVGNAPPTIGLTEPDGIDDIADDSYIIRYSASDSDNPDANIYLYYSTRNDLEESIVAELKKLDEDGNLQNDPKSLSEIEGLEYLEFITADLTVDRTEYDWRTTKRDNKVADVPEGKYYIYAAIQDIVVLATAPEVIKIKRTVVTKSSGIVTIEHSPKIWNVSPANPTTERDGSYLITWNDKKYGSEDGKIALYYSTEADLATIVDIKQSAASIAGNLSEDADEENGQYNWNFRETAVLKGTYYIYGIIDDADFAISDSTLTIVYPPHIKLISPIAQGSKAVDTFTISWIDEDIDDNARINFYHSKTPGVPPIQGLPSDAVQINASTLLEDDEDSFLWNITSELAGSYYIYASITDDGVNYVYAVSPGTLTIRRVDIRLRPNAIVLGAGDKFTVDVEVKTNGIEISGVSVYMSFDADFLKVKDQDEVTPGIQPFAQPTHSIDLFGSLTTTTSVLYNSTHGDTETTTGRFRLGYAVADTGSNYENTGNIFRKLASVTFTAHTEPESGPVNTTVSFDFDEAHGRSTTVITTAQDDISAISPTAQVPAATIQIAPLATISGRVLFEERTVHKALVTFELREPGKIEPLATYAPKSTVVGDGGDEDTTKPGVQVTTRPDGSYLLINVPSGRWELTAKATPFLRGYGKSGSSRIMEVVAGDYLQGIDIVNKEGEDKLLGGDVDDDNRINALDFATLSSAFGLGKGEQGFVAAADLNGDDRVGVSDFAILSKNFGKIGIPPTATELPPTAAPGDVIAGCGVISSSPLPKTLQPGEIFEVPILVENASDIKGYVVELTFDPTILQLIDAQAIEGDMLKANPDGAETLFISVVRDESNLKKVITASMIAGQGEGASGSGLLAKLRFQYRSAKIKSSQYGSAKFSQSMGSATSITIDNILAAGRNNQFVPISHASTYVLEALKTPTKTLLLQNYPNPFNPDTWIPYRLSVDSPVEVRIYDVAGKLVRRFSIGYQSAGDYTHREDALYWDGRNIYGERVTSGIYFYQFIAGKHSAVKKLTLLK